MLIFRSIISNEMKIEFRLQTKGVSLLAFLFLMAKENEFRLELFFKGFLILDVIKSCFDKALLPNAGF